MPVPSSHLSVAIAALLAALLELGFAAPVKAEQPDAKDQPSDQDDKNASDLAKAVQNPVADLISVPFQNNTSYNIGTNERAANTLNIQPVIPVHLSERLLLITRTILPITYQPDLT